MIHYEPPNFAGKELNKDLGRGLKVKGSKVFFIVGYSNKQVSKILFLN